MVMYANQVEKKKTKKEKLPEIKKKPTDNIYVLIFGYKTLNT